MVLVHAKGPLELVAAVDILALDWLVTPGRTYMLSAVLPWTSRSEARPVLSIMDWEVDLSESG